MPTIAYPYLRYSSAKQHDGDSARRQSEWHEQVAKQYGYVLDYSMQLEDRGRSAFHGDNFKHDLGRFLTAISEKKIPHGSVLLFEEFDRFSRMQPRKARRLLEEVLEGGVDVRTRERLYTEADLDDFGTDFQIRFKQWTAHDESRKKSMRLKSNWENWRREISKGKKIPPPGQMPPWVGWDESKQEFFLKPEKAEAIRLIFKLVRNGLGIRKVIKHLEEHNVSSIAPNKTRWTVAYLGKLTTSRMVLGDLIDADGRTHAGFYPAVVTETEWLQARGGLQVRKLGQQGAGGRLSEKPNLFMGVVFDARNGEPMYLNRKDANHRKLFSRSGGLGIPIDLLDEAFLELVRELNLSDLVDGTLDSEMQRFFAAEANRRQLLANIKQVQERIEKENPIPAFLDLIAKWSKELAEVEKEKEQLAIHLAQQGEKQLEDLQKVAGKVRESLDDKEMRLKLRSHIRQLVSSIWIYVWDITVSYRAAMVHVNFQAGGRRVLLLSWTTKWKKFDSLKIGQLVDPTDLAGKKLEDYVRDPATRAWVDERPENVNPLLLRLWKENPVPEKT